MERLRLWLRAWLGIDELFSLNVLQTDALVNLEVRLKAVQDEVARLRVERYVPPSTPEPERKVIRAQTFKQYQDIVEQEQEKLIQEQENAIR